MAKSKIQFDPLNSWYDVDLCLKEICECEIQLAELEAEYNREINEAKEKKDRLVKTIKSAITMLSERIKYFVTDNQKDISGKSKSLNYGVVGLRKSTKITYSTAKVKEILKSLKENDMRECIDTAETINKNALSRYNDEDLEKVGVKRKTSNEFFLDSDWEKLR